MLLLCPLASFYERIRRYFFHAILGVKLEDQEECHQMLEETDYQTDSSWVGECLSV